MKKIHFKKINRNIPPVGYGCLQLSYPHALNQEQINQLIQQAYDDGVRLFDTAAAYGVERHNEIVLSKALRSIKYDESDKPIIVTKCGINFSDGGKYRQTPKEIFESLNTSLKIFGVDCLDLFLLHRIDPQLDTRAFTETITALKRTVTNGKARAIGLSEPTAEQIKACYLIPPLDVPISVIEFAYSIFSRRADQNGVMQTSQELDINVIAYTSVIRGAVNTKLQQLSTHEINTLNSEQLQTKVFDIISSADPSFTGYDIGLFDQQHIKGNIKQVIQFHQDANQLGVSPAQLALAWLAHVNVVSIPGTSCLEYLHENSIVNTLTIPEKVLDEITEKYPPGSFLGNPNPVTLQKLDNPELEFIKNSATTVISTQKPAELSMCHIRDLLNPLLLDDNHRIENLSDYLNDQINIGLLELFHKGDIRCNSDKLLAISIADYRDNKSEPILAACGYNHQSNNTLIDTHTCFNLASVSKFILMNLTLILLQEQKLKLTNTLDMYLHSESIPNKSNITIAHLLSQTSGLEDIDLFMPFGKFDNLKKLLKTEHKRKIGDFYYSNINFYLLALVLEIVSGQDLKMLFNEKIKTPLKLNDTYLVEPHDKYDYTLGYNFIDNQLKATADTIVYGATSFRSTPRDIVTLYQNFFLNPEYIQPISRKIVIASCQSVNFEVNTRLGKFCWPAVIGYAIERHELTNNRIVAYGNGGWIDSHACFSVFIPKMNRALCVMASKTNGIHS